MRATFAVHIPVDERTAEAIHHFGKPHFTSGKSVHLFHFEAHGVPPVQVHALQHLGPVVGLGAAHASLNGDEAVAMVVLLREQTLRLHLVHVRNHLVDGFIHFGKEFGIVAFLGHFIANGGIFKFAHHQLERLNLRAHDFQLIDGFLCRTLVTPEFRGFHLGRQSFTLEDLCWVVKESRGWL